MPVRREDDRGQLMLLVLAYTLLAAVLVAVVVDAATVFIRRRALTAVADGAALAAAQALDRPAFYGGGAHGDLPLDPDAADRAVENYVVASDAGARFDELEIEPPSVSPNPHVVTVRLHCRVSVPFGAGFAGLPRTVAMTVSASARNTAP